jgi:eukaryotic-like serine/threonine-protein kinase
VAALLQRQLEGKYEILEKIKEGGMGAVYKVRHRFLDEIRVIKVIRSTLEPSQEISDRFLREARMAIRLRHPSIAVLHDFAVDDDGKAFIVMEHIAGLTLEDVLRAGGPPPLGLALEIASQALRAMGYLHRHGFVHRDVAPDNLMLTRGVDGEPLVKLIDLGIAKVLAGEGAATTTGIFLGKPRYASPEQFGAREIDHRSDLYSFGVVFYELLTGKCPVAGNDPASYMAGHLFRPPLDFAASDPGGALPAELRRIVLRALAKAPGERFASAADFARAIAPLQEQFAVQPGDLEAALQPPMEKTALWSAPPPAGSSQVLLDRQFLAGTTPPPAAGQLEAGQPAVTRPAVASLAGTQPAATPLAGVPPARPRASGAGELPLPAARQAPAAPAAEDWEARLLHRTGPPGEARAAGGGGPTLGFQHAATAPPTSAAGEVRSPAVGTSARATRAWVAGALLLVAGTLGGGAWWYLHSQATAEHAGSSRGKAAPWQEPGVRQPAGTAAPAGVSAAEGPAGTAAPAGVAAAAGPVVAASAVGPKGAAGPTASPAPAMAPARGARPRSRPARAGASPATDADRAATPSLAPDPPGPGGEVAEPVEIPEAIYPAAARGTGREPRVLLAVLVDEHGGVAEVRVKEGDSSRLGFDEAAVAAARKARFLPATRNGAPVRSWSELMIEFVSPPQH